MQMHARATRILAILGALSTLAFMVTMARPWGDNDAYQGLGGYLWLLFLALWAILPYLLLFIMANRVVNFKNKAIFLLIGALIMVGGGMAAYVDAMWLHPDPQGGLVFIAVPLYQWIIVGLLAGFLWLAKKGGAP